MCGCWACQFNLVSVGGQYYIGQHSRSIKNSAKLFYVVRLFSKSETDLVC